MLRTHVIRAVFRRNVLSYFSGVLGYLFIIVFVVVGAYLAFSPQFFTNNMANLDQLSFWFPRLLLFIVPAITMSVWADERKLGTDELLFTLPASDFEIMLGKYLAVLAVYAIALCFSLTQLFVLGYIGDPDWGLIFSTYLGYFLAGGTLLSAGMFASVLTSSTTVAFVLGTVVCAIPVFVGLLAPLVEDMALLFGGQGPANDFVLSLSLSEQLRDFTMGMVPLSGLLYFLSLTAFFLYLNLVFISKRHWSSAEKTNMGTQFVVRAIALVAILISVNVLASFKAVRADVTAENLYSLSATTRSLLDKIDKDHPVDIQAFISPEVPRDYVAVRQRLIGLLRQYDQMGGTRIDVRYVDVEPSSEKAEEAKMFGITPVRIQTERDGRRIQEDIFLGVVIGSRYDEVVVPFFGAGTPLEYELTRSIRTVSNEKRLTVGVLRTDAQMLTASSEWQIITELKQQYNVEEVSPDSAIEEDKYDVLIAVLPSSLTQPQMANLVDYVRQGHPALIFADPYPWVFNSGFGVVNAPRQSKPRPGGMFGGMGSPPPEQKADQGKLTSLLRVLDIAWDNGQIVWDQFNPHPQFFDVVPEEFLFISPQSGTRSAFSQKSEITSGLQEMLSAFAGTIRPRADSDLKFVPLLRTGRTSGLLDWDEFTTSAFDPSRMQSTAQLRPQRPRITDEDAHVIAAHITSGKKKGDGQINVVFVSDIDLISDWFFFERQRGEANLNLDNVTFVLNAVDVLADDKSFIDLRKRRAASRTLLAVEARVEEFQKQRKEEQTKADDEANKALELARERFEKQRQKIEEDGSLDPRTKEIMLRNLKANEERRLEVTEANIKRKKEAELEGIKNRTNRQIRSTENSYMYKAILLPALPAIALGLLVLLARTIDEKRNVTPERHI